MRYKLKDLVALKYGKSQKSVEDNKNGKYPILGTGGIIGYAKEPLYNKPSVLIGRKGTIDKIRYVDSPFWTIDTLFYTEINTDLIKPQYLYYRLLDVDFKNLNEGTTIPSLRTQTLYEIELEIDDIQTQNKIVDILAVIDKKIKQNTHTNNNLEEQLKYIFYTSFYKDIENNNTEKYTSKTLYDVLDVIDNRGKTPKTVKYSKYPIIDVRAISGEGRILDYKKCQKYVDLETYNTFFRNGHPKKNDILISTVGSLAELKIYIDNKGTIAQNVVALRSKDNYSLYYYQYLKAIKNDLISYNIGSVQPSIKVTQFMKHIIYIPNQKKLNEFNNKAEIITNKIYCLSKEIETLGQIRDTLLPKLMNGEIDLDKIEI